MSRKGENIFKRKDGRWEARYVKGYNLDGTCKYGFLYGKSYQEVKEKRISVLMNYEMYKKSPKFYGKVRFEDKVNQWLKEEKLTIKISTYSYYCSVVNKHIIPELGNVMLENIDEQLIVSFMTNLVESNELKVSTIKEIIVILKQILNYCGLNIKVKPPRPEKKKISVLKKGDKERLERYLQTNVDECSIGILLSLYAGLRIGEVCALKWKDIDFNAGILSVNRTVSRVNNLDLSGSKTKLILVEAKTKNSVRQIPLNTSFMKLLKIFKKNKDDNFFILSSNSTFMDPRSYYNQYKRILKKCNMENYNYHSLRHTFATNCIELGLDPKSLSEILGHSDIKITLSLYVHPSLDVKRNFMNKKFVCFANN